MKKLPNLILDFVNAQTIIFDKIATVFATDSSVEKREYPMHRKRTFKFSDLFYVFGHIQYITKLFRSFKISQNICKEKITSSKTTLSQKEFNKLQNLIEQLQVDEWGVFKATPSDIFRGHGIPSPYVIVLSMGMNKEKFHRAPHIECQIEVARLYGDTGEVANEVALFLRGIGSEAYPNHSMGGQIDYSMAAEQAGIGIIGRHSMAMTPSNGACNRLAVIYTNIQNLEEYLTNQHEEISWIGDFCKSCGKCIRQCPTKAIFETPILINNIPTRIDYEKCCDNFISYGCGICIKECPFTSIGYKKLKQAFLKN